MASEKRQPLNIRFDAELQTELEKIAKAWGLTRSEVVRILTAAGSAAIKRQGYRVSLPLKFSISDEKDSSS